MRRRHVKTETLLYGPNRVVGRQSTERLQFHRSVGGKGQSEFFRIKFGYRHAGVATWSVT
jgi:hypothetical protein